MQKALSLVLLISLWIAMTATSLFDETRIVDKPFIQEYHQAHIIGDKPDVNEVRAVVVDRDGHVWAATKAGAYVLKKGERLWSSFVTKMDAGPTFDVIIDSNNIVWIGAWNGIYRASASGLEKIEGIDQPI